MITSLLATRSNRLRVTDKFFGKRGAVRAEWTEAIH